MREKSVWSWKITSRTGEQSRHGTVDAVDPRDAFSRALTSALEDGRMVGESFKVPISALDGCPANYDDEATIEGETFIAHVQKAA